MEFYDVIRRRRSVRKYKKDEVEEEKLERILDSARLAPSAANVQPWVFYVVRDERLKSRLKSAYGQEWFYTAPLIIVGCANAESAWKRGDGKSYADVDFAIAFEHIILSATAEGLGTCWIGAFDPDVVRRVLGLPKELEPVAMTPLGYPDETPDPKPRKALEEITRRL